MTAHVGNEREAALRSHRWAAMLSRFVTQAPLGVRAAICLAIIGLALLASMRIPIVPGSKSPPHEYVVLFAITALTIVVVLWLRRSLNIGPSAADQLPLPLYTLYLAALILLGTYGGVALAALASLHPLLTDGIRWPRPQKVVAVLRMDVIAVVTTFLAGVVFSAVSLHLPVGSNGLRAHLIAGVAAMLVILAGASISRIRDWGSDGLWSAQTWSVYLHSPTFRFQVLLLSIGPLLPLVAVLDDVETELAWVLFLLPLYAIYYLALVSVSLQERTDELQRTVQALALARERQAALKGYAALVTRAQEEERRRLSRELHDDTAQALIALSRGLDALASRPADPPLSARDSHFLAELGSLAKRTLEGIRRACQNLRPSVLDDLGLAAALESLASSLGKQGVRCEYIESGEAYSSAPEVEVTVYRIAQEAVSNALRHAQAAHVTISLTYTSEALELVVRDDGRGFDTLRQEAARPAAADGGSENSSGLGLLGMRERAALIGAALDVVSMPGQGTAVRVSVPVAAPAPQQAVALSE
ncbi:MAG TPA: sensor histidine kinase [Ktedonobacterales bacterium]